MDKNFAKNMALSLQSKLENCKSIKDYLELAYSFTYHDFTLSPFQLKNEIYLLIEILALKKPKTILEIGTSNGGSLFLISKFCPKNSTIISIDLPNGKFGGEFFPEWKNSFYESFASDQQKIHLIRSNSHDESTKNIVKDILKEKKLDFLFIDGDHSYSGVKKDFEMYNSLLSENGIIVFHDICNGPLENVGDVPKFWKEIKSEHEVFEIIDSDNTIGYGLGFMFKESALEKSSLLYQILKRLRELQNQINIETNKQIHKNLYQINKHIKNFLEQIEVKTLEQDKTSKYVKQLLEEIEVKTLEQDKTSKYVKQLLEELEQKNQYINNLERDIKVSKNLISSQKYYTSRL